MQRTMRHAVLFLASVALCAGLYFALPSGEPVWRLSMATAYCALSLLALSLMIGPWNRLRGRPNPVSGYLRRDIGIWAGVLGIAHVVFGLQVHFVGRMWSYFALPDALKFTQWMIFGTANYVGLGATLILLMLLGLSNDASLRTLGPARWKSLQRWNYAGAVLVIGHGTLFQIIEKRTPGFIAVFAALVLIALTLQVAGFRAVRRT